MIGGVSERVMRARECGLGAEGCARPNETSAAASAGALTSEAVRPSGPPTYLPSGVVAMEPCVSESAGEGGTLGGGGGSGGPLAPTRDALALASSEKMTRAPPRR
jgi:hypothetical protein